MSDLWDKIVPGTTYHIFPDIAKNKTIINERLAAILTDPFFGAVQVPPVGDEGIARTVAASFRLSATRLVYGVGGSLARLGLDLHSLDTTKRAESISKAKELIDEAYLLGAVLIDLNPAKDPGPDRRAEAKAALVDSLTELCEYSVSKNREEPIAISMEHFDRDVDKKYLLGPTSETVEVIEQVKRKVSNIGVTMDISHLMLLGEDPAQSVKIASSHILHAHLSNYILREGDPRSGDHHPPFWVSYGMVGPREVASFLHALDRVGYFKGEADNPRRGLVTFEIRPGTGETPEMIIAGSKRILRIAAEMAR